MKNLVIIVSNYSFGGMTMVAILRDGDMVLRSPESEDFDDYRSWWEDREANYLDNGNYDSIDIDRILSKLDIMIKSGRLEGWFTVCLLHKPIGYINYRNINNWRNDGEIAIRLGRENWGKGLGKKAINILKDYMFKTLRLKSIWLEVYDFNIAAIKAYQGAGFEIEGQRKDKGKVIIKMRCKVKNKVL